MDRTKLEMSLCGAFFFLENEHHDVSVSDDKSKSSSIDEHERNMMETAINKDARINMYLMTRKKKEKDGCRAVVTSALISASIFFLNAEVSHMLYADILPFTNVSCACSHLGARHGTKSGWSGRSMCGCMGGRPNFFTSFLYC